MKILYVAKHDSGGNDDEGAIAFALRQLGHEVECWPESRGEHAYKFSADFLLCHHWRDMESLHRVRIPKVSWCFDLIKWDGSPRHKERETWARNIMSECRLSFFTDGAWVAESGGNARWLMQGFDERQNVIKCVGTGIKFHGILFVGSRGYGREDFLTEMLEEHGDRFYHIAKNRHGQALAYEVARASIIVAPDSPIRSNYWSNRVYLTLGFGGFLLHPWCEDLARHYRPNELCTYQDREHLHLLIEHYLDPAYTSIREKVAEAGHQRTLHHHLYRHRCVELIEVVRKELGK